jgi:hypothetical protein
MPTLKETISLKCWATLFIPSSKFRGSVILKTTVTKKGCCGCCFLTLDLQSCVVNTENMRIESSKRDLFHYTLP